MHLLRRMFMNILMWWEDFDGRIPIPTILKPRPQWTGKQIFSLIIPRQINLRRPNFAQADGELGDMSPSDAMVWIEKGEVISGILCKKSLGTASGGLILVICKVCGWCSSKLTSSTTRTRVCATQFMPRRHLWLIHRVTSLILRGDKFFCLD